MPRRRRPVNSNMVWVGQIVPDNSGGTRYSSKWVGRGTSRARVKAQLEAAIQQVVPGAEFSGYTWRDSPGFFELRYQTPDRRMTGWITGSLMSGPDAQAIVLDLTPWPELPEAPAPAPLPIRSFSAAEDRLAGALPNCRCSACDGQRVRYLWDTRD